MAEAGVVAPSGRCVGMSRRTGRGAGWAGGKDRTVHGVLDEKVTDNLKNQGVDRAREGGRRAGRGLVPRQRRGPAGQWAGRTQHGEVLCVRASFDT